MKKAFFNTLYELAKENANLQFIKGDTAYIPDYQAAFPNQYLDVGIAEQNMIGIAAGMAFEGKIPFTYSIVNFATMRCLEQIRNDIAYHNLNVKIVSCGVGFDYGALGATHHATEDLAIMRALPNITVFSPCDPVETVAVTKAAFMLNGPCFIRNGHGGEPVLHKEILNDFKVGKAIRLKEGNDIAIFVTGSIANDALRGAELLENEKIHAGVYSFPTVKPIDKDLILSCAKTTRLILTVEEHTIIGGFGSAVAEVIAEAQGCKARFKRIGINDTFTSEIGTREYQKSFYNVDGTAIASVALSILNN
jgi:transketolase